MSTVSDTVFSLWKAEQTKEWEYTNINVSLLLLVCNLPRLSYAKCLLCSILIMYACFAVCNTKILRWLDLVPWEYLSNAATRCFRAALPILRADGIDSIEQESFLVRGIICPTCSWRGLSRMPVQVKDFDVIFC